MSEWWTYTLRDLLLFSSRTYYRLFEIYNAAIWPAQIVAVVLALTVWVLLRRGATGARARVVGAILASCWLWIAIAFHAKRYATINTFGVHCAWAFGIEATLWIAIGVIGGEIEFAPKRTGLWIFAFALLIEPLAAPLLGRGWQGIELFGVAPDPTAVATLGALLAARGRWRWALMIVPVVWCAVTGLTLLAMKAPDFWIAPLAAVVAVVMTASQHRSGMAS
jgi:hypothetical protein